MKKIRKMSALVPDLVIDILLCLPVRSLIRFKCLSRSLCTEIESENFVKNHLNRSIQSSTHQKLIVYIAIFEGPGDFYHADFDDDLVDAFPLNKPFLSRYSHASVYGSCNGLILLGVYVKVGYKSLGLAIWNPFTRRYKELPLCPVQTLAAYRDRALTSSGLGYDSADDDYKIVMISNVDDSNQVWVFSLKSDFWRRSQDLKDKVILSLGRFANGALYWECEIENKVVGFDVAKEVFFDIPLPSDYDAPAPYLYTSLVVLRGNLCFYCTTEDNYKNVDYHLLVSDASDKGGEVVRVNWRKEFTMEDVEVYNYYPYPPQPLAYSKDGDSILFCELQRFFWHNPENRTEQEVNFAGLRGFTGYNVCWESLVSVGKDGAFDGAAEDVIIDDSVELNNLKQASFRGSRL